MTSPTPRSPSPNQRRRAHTPFEARTVALLNRGVPSFAVETDGTLHTSLDAFLHRLAVRGVDDA